jgi:O-glycosyl hydrolase
MLDSQKSLKQKDYNEKRKSKAAESIIYEGPLSLPADKGERQTLLTIALQEALEKEYSTDYQIILKKYFKYLEEQGVNEK